MQTFDIVLFVINKYIVHPYSEHWKDNAEGSLCAKLHYDILHVHHTCILIDMLTVSCY